MLIDPGRSTRARAGVGVRGRLDVPPPTPRLQHARLTDKEAEDGARDPLVAAMGEVMPTSLVRPTHSSDGASAGTAWGVSAVGADRSRRRGSGVSVAVLDTGLDDTHEAFDGVMLTMQDFSGSGPQDAQGHGTHCAATILGRDVLGRRIGVAPGVSRLFSAKVLDDHGAGTTAMLAEGLIWAMRQKADVVSMSLGLDFPGMVSRLAGAGMPVEVATSRALEAYRQNLLLFDALLGYNRALPPFGAGATIIAAAGNESRRELDADWDVSASLPAASDGAVSVGAAGRSPNGLVIAGFSNSRCKIAAPGVDVPSARAGGGLATMSGTSMAAPHVAGVAALWVEELRATSSHVTPELVTAQILGRAQTAVFCDDVPDVQRGAGLVTAP